MAPVAKKVAKKTAPAPKVEAAVPETYQVGDRVKFLGYAEGVAADMQYLTPDTIYDIAEITETGEINVNLPNVEFDESKPDSEDNPKMYMAPVLADEIEYVPAEADAAVTEEAPAEEAPAPVAAKKAAAKKTAPAAKKTVAVVEPEPVVDPITPDLENEDPDILALVNGDDVDLRDLIINLESQGNRLEWQTAGALYHLKKSKAYEGYDIDKKTKVAPYAAEGGWALFVETYFGMQYRKAMSLIQIYVSFTQIGVVDPADVMATIGWTKASKLAPVFQKVELSDSKYNKLMEAATNETSDGLSTYIDDKIKQKKGEDAKAPTQATTTVKLKFLEADGDMVKKTLTVAMDTLTVKTVEDAFLAILTQWATANAGGQAPAAAAPVSRPVATKTAVKPVARKVEVAAA